MTSFVSGAFTGSDLSHGLAWPSHQEDWLILSACPNQGEHVGKAVFLSTPNLGLFLHMNIVSGWQANRYRTETQEI